MKGLLCSSSANTKIKRPITATTAAKNKPMMASRNIAEEEDEEEEFDHNATNFFLETFTILNTRNPLLNKKVQPILFEKHFHEDGENDQNNNEKKNNTMKM